MAQTTFVGAEIDKSRSDEWDKFIDESTEFNSKAQLIRAGVERLINDVESDDVDDEIERLREDIDTVLRVLRDTREEVNRLEDEFADVEEIAQETVYMMDLISEDVYDS